MTLHGGLAPFTASGTNWTLIPSSNSLVNYADLTMATVFQASDISNILAFTAIYDQYKLLRVGCEIEYLNNVSSAGTPGLMPTVYLYWDRDDATIPSNLMAIARRQGVKRRQFGNLARTQIRTRNSPNLLMTVKDGILPNTVDSVVPKAACYMDCSNDSVPHYALKAFITDIYLPGAGATQAFRFNWTYDIAFKAPLATA